MSTKQFDAENLAKHKKRCDEIEGLARAEDENRRLRNELAMFRDRVEQFGKLLYDTNRMLRESDQLSERERQILDMWPRFEDGGYVCFGDAFVDDQGGERRVAHIALSERSACIADSKLLGSDRASGEAFKRPAPKVLDADGVEIKVGDTVWHHSGFAHGVVTSIDAGSLMNTTRYVDEGGTEFRDAARSLTHACPDSWERLEEDAEKIRCDIARNLGDFSPSDFADEGDSVQSRVIDIIRCAKALAGVEVGE